MKKSVVNMSGNTSKCLPRKETLAKSAANGTSTKSGCGEAKSGKSTGEETVSEVKVVNRNQMKRTNVKTGAVGLATRSVQTAASTFKEVNIKAPDKTGKIVGLQSTSGKETSPERLGACSLSGIKSDKSRMTSPVKPAGFASQKTAALAAALRAAKAEKIPRQGLSAPLLFSKPPMKKVVSANGIQTNPNPFGTIKKKCPESDLNQELVCDSRGTGFEKRSSTQTTGEPTSKKTEKPGKSSTKASAASVRPGSSADIAFRGLECNGTCDKCGSAIPVEFEEKLRSLDSEKENESCRQQKELSFIQEKLKEYTDLYAELSQVNRIKDNILADSKKQYEETKAINVDLHRLVNDQRDLYDEAKKQLAKCFDEKKEWMKMEKDYLLCIRSAERFKEEAEERCRKLEAERREWMSGQGSLPKETQQPDVVIDNVCSELSLMELSNKNQVKCDSDRSSKTKEDLGITLKDSTNTCFDECSERPPLHVERITAAGQTSSKTAASLIFASQVAVISPEDDLGSLNKENSVNSEKKLSGWHENEKLLSLRKSCGGSLRNALLGWCQRRTASYMNVDITNFSESWKDGFALSALIHSFAPSSFDYKTLVETKCPEMNFRTAVLTAKDLGVTADLDVEGILNSSCPPWENILHYVAEIYCALDTEMSG